MGTERHHNQGGSRRLPKLSPREAATAVARTLRDAGHIAYFAGGCVRDELLGREPDDYDVATDAPPERVVELFDRTHTVGAAFAVVLVRMGGHKIEVATFRTDGSYTDSRRPDSVELSTPEEDAKRRDFTINAMFLDPFVQGSNTDPAAGVVDLVGGLADLRAGVIRAVGDPEQRLIEDHLRALRAIRFAARFGFDLEETTARAIRAHAADLRGVSRERIGDEVRRMLRAPSRARAIGRIESLGLGASVLGHPPEHEGSIEREAVLGFTGPVPAVAPESVSGTAPKIDPQADVNPVLLGLVAWAIARSPKQIAKQNAPSTIAGAYRSALMLSNGEHAGLRAALAALCEYLHFEIDTADGPVASLASASTDQRKDRARFKRLASAPGAAGALMLLDRWRPELSANIRRALAALADDGIGLAPAPMITGDDLISEGWRPGPQFGNLLDAIYDDQLVGLATDRGALLSRAMEHAARLGVQRG
jgi:poly(A) polymerase